MATKAAKRSDIVFLTDFGLSDWYVATMKGVARRIAPGAGLIDLTHDIAPGGIAQADFVLSQAAPFFAAGTVFCVVVDPEVGSSRRALACGDGERFYVAPDNGVLSRVARAAGARWRCYEASNPQWRLPETSHTFHGRDVFAPVAAWLTRKSDVSLCGPAVSDPVLLPESLPEKKRANSWRGSVVYIDRFGNAVTSFHRGLPPFNSSAMADNAIVIELIDIRLKGVKRSFHIADSGEPLAYWGSGGYLEVGVNLGDAARRYNIRVGDPVLVAIK